MLALEVVLGVAFLDAAGEAGVPIVFFLLQLLAGKNGLLAVDDDDIVTAIHGWREDGLVLAAQSVGDDGGKTANNQAFRVNQHPLLLDIRRLCGEGFQESCLSGFGDKRKTPPQRGVSSDAGIGGAAASVKYYQQNICVVLYYHIFC